jgi:hypothetical protein
MVIVIKIQDIWIRHDEESLALCNVGLSVKEAVTMAFGFAAISQLPANTSIATYGRCDIVSAVRDVMSNHLSAIDRLPLPRKSGYGLEDVDNNRGVLWIVERIGEISHMLADAVIKQLGTFPPQLRLLRFIGQDLVLTY